MIYLYQYTAQLFAVDFFLKDFERWFLPQEQGNQLKTIYIHTVDERRAAPVGVLKTRKSWDTRIHPWKVTWKSKPLEDNFPSQKCWPFVSQPTKWPRPPSTVPTGPSAWGRNSDPATVGSTGKWWVSPNNSMDFPTKNDQPLGCEMGKPTIFLETPIVNVSKGCFGVCTMKYWW